MPTKLRAVRAAAFRAAVARGEARRPAEIDLKGRILRALRDHRRMTTAEIVAATADGLSYRTSRVWSELRKLHAAGVVRKEPAPAAYSARQRGGKRPTVWAVANRGKESS
jgi:transposase